MPSFKPLKYFFNCSICRLFCLGLLCSVPSGELISKLLLPLLAFRKASFTAFNIPLLDTVAPETVSILVFPLITLLSTLDAQVKYG